MITYIYNKIYVYYINIINWCIYYSYVKLKGVFMCYILYINILNEYDEFI